MNSVLILKRHYSDGNFFEVEKAECSDEEYKRYTAICDSYYYKIDITETHNDLRFGNYSSYKKTIEKNIPYENILIRDGEVVGFLYDTSQTPDGFEGYKGQMVFLLDYAGKEKDVGGRASVGVISTHECCTLLSR